SSIGCVSGGSPRTSTASGSRFCNFAPVFAPPPSSADAAGTRAGRVHTVMIATRTSGASLARLPQMWIENRIAPPNKETWALGADRPGSVNGQQHPEVLPVPASLYTRQSGRRKSRIVVQASSLHFPAHDGIRPARWQGGPTQ